MCSKPRTILVKAGEPATLSKTLVHKFLSSEPFRRKCPKVSHYTLPNKWNNWTFWITVAHSGDLGKQQFRIYSKSIPKELSAPFSVSRSRKRPPLTEKVVCEMYVWGKSLLKYLSDEFMFLLNSEWNIATGSRNKLISRAALKDWKL